MLAPGQSDWLGTIKKKQTGVDVADPGMSECHSTVIRGLATPELPARNRTQWPTSRIARGKLDLFYPGGTLEQRV